MSTYPIKFLEISHSTLNMFDLCPRKLEFSKLYGFNLRDETTASAGGNALHAAVGEYLVSKDKQAAIFKLIQEYPIHLCKNPLWKWSLEACYGALIKIINYLDTHTELELAYIGDTPAVEIPFMINIKHNIDGLMPVFYRGYIDFIFYNRLDNSYKVIDLKGTTFNTADYVPMWKYDSQCLPYAMLLKSALHEDLESLYVEYLVTKIDLVAPEIHPLEFHKSEQDIKEWAQDLMVRLQSIKTYIETEWFPRRSKGCINFGRLCKFYNICDTRNSKTIKAMLSSMDLSEPQEFEPLITLDLELTA